MKETMGESVKSTSALKDKIGVVIGFGFAPHPATEGKFVGGHAAVMLLRTPDEWVLCLSEGEGQYDWEAARAKLGKKMPGESFFLNAARGIGKEIPFWKLKEIADASFKEEGFKMEWVGDDDEPWLEIIPGPPEEGVAPEAQGALT